MTDRSTISESFYHISREEEIREQVDDEDKLKELNKEVT